jgi:succinate dehydrogenase / fumarate reductase cytochrome b subunit
METFTSAVWSSVGRKILNGLTGLLLSAFILVHLVENLLLFAGPEPYNMYVHRLLSLGALIYVAEIILASIFVVHMASAVTVWLGKRRARPQRYAVRKSAGDPSRQTIFSPTMIYTGALLLVFLVLHLKTFKWGPHYEATYDGLVVRDLHRLVVEVFSSGGYFLWYELVMILLGFHLRHGFWSAFQSLGLEHPKYSPIIFTVGILFAIVIAIGFLAIPAWIFVTGGAA